MSDPLKKFYLRSLAVGAWVITVLGVSISFGIQAVLDLFNQESHIFTALKLLLSIGVIGSLFRWYEKLVREDLWKHAYPQFDFSGDWNAKTTYETIQGRDFESGELPSPAEHKAVFVQDCLNITVKSSSSPQYTGGWWSLLAGVGQEGKDDPFVHYFYTVIYSPGDKFPRATHGYEKIHVSKFGENNKPVEVHGYFDHCTGQKVNAYSGSIVFSRESQPLGKGLILSLKSAWASFCIPK